MSHKEAAIAGVRDNGLRWCYTLRGVKNGMEALRKVLETAPSHEPIDAALHEIGRCFRRFLDQHPDLADEMTMAQSDAVAWLEQESCRYEFEHGEMEEFRNNVDHYMGELYDWADYHRVLLTDRP